MSTVSGRPGALADHPLHDRRYRLPTPPIEALYALITDALDRRRPGVMVYGRSRLGKTTAIAYIEALLGVERPKLPVVTLRCRFKRVPSEIAFFSNLLSAVRHKATSGRDAEQMRQRLIHRVCEMADDTKASQVLLFADEAQDLTACEYEWLRDAHDDLQRWGKTLLVVRRAARAARAEGELPAQPQPAHRLAVHGARARLSGRPQRRGLRHLPAGLRPTGVSGGLGLGAYPLLFP